MSLSRDSCIRQSQSLYLRIGPRALLISKFLPGAGALSTSLAGMTGTPLRRFLGYDFAGSALWVGSALLLGAIFSDTVDSLLGWLHDYATRGLLLLLAAFALFIAWRLWQRYSLLRRTARIPRISVEELRERLDQGDTPLILDVRAEAGEDGIPGAIPVTLDTPLDGLADSLGQADVVIYCACPNELSAAMLAERLRKHGYPRAWALSGGLEAWQTSQAQAGADGLS